MAIDFIEGKFGDKAIRLSGSDVFVPIGLGERYTILLYRKLEVETEWTQIIKLSNGDVYNNENKNSGYDTSWMSVNVNGDLYISSLAEDIDELLIVPYHPSQEVLTEWTTINRPFYDVVNEASVVAPTTITMEVL